MLLHTVDRSRIILILTSTPLVSRSSALAALNRETEQCRRVDCDQVDATQSAACLSVWRFPYGISTFEPFHVCTRMEVPMKDR